MKAHHIRSSRRNNKNTNTNDNKKGKPLKKGWKIALIVLTSVVVTPIAALLVYFFIATAALNKKIELTTPQFETEIGLEATNFGAIATATGAAATSIPDISNNDISNVQNVSLDLYSAAKITNILLLGLDSRNPEQFSGGRTDTIIIASLDTGGKIIKLTSIMRDTLVSIPGHDMNRINAVFGFSGPEVAMQTVQKYFGVKIDYYAVVNFWAMADIIDSLKGVQIEIKKAEISNLNTQLDEINKYSKSKNSPHIRRSGLQKLDGKQAVAYMRIRHVGEADFERTARQRKVLEAITKRDFSLNEIISLVNVIPKYMRTNMNQVQMLAMAKTAFDLKGAPIKQIRLPVDKSFKMTRYKGMSILIVDFAKNSTSLKAFLEGK